MLYTIMAPCLASLIRLSEISLQIKAKMFQQFQESIKLPPCPLRSQRSVGKAQVFIAKQISMCVDSPYVFEWSPSTRFYFIDIVNFCGSQFGHIDVLSYISILTHKRLKQR